MKNDSKQTLMPVPEVGVSGIRRESQSLQLPLIPDPGKIGDMAPTEKLDFSVRLGTSLARENETREKTRRRSSITVRSSVSPKTTRSLSVNESLLTFPNTREGSRDSFSRFGVNNGTKASRKKRDSRPSRSHVFTSYVTDSESPKIKFQRIIRTIRVISSVCLALKRYVGECETKEWSFMEMYLHVKEDMDRLVVFNPHNFTRIEPERCRLKKLLAIPNLERNVDHLRAILALMRGNSSFQDYPGQIQEQLAQCMEYQGYEARRVVLKQGHRPEAFYILLSGYVIANVQDTSPTTNKMFIRTVHEMGPGATFGEIALIDGVRRTASIVCKTAVELLVILKDDFDAIIRVPLLRQRDEHVNFCKSVPLLRDFPCEKLTENPSQFFYQYFKKGDTVVRNSLNSKHIIVIKAGTCRVVSTFLEAVPTVCRPSTAASSIKAMDHAFPLYAEMKNIPSMMKRPKTETELLKDKICLGLLTGTIDKIRLADHGPEIQRPKTSIENKDDKPKTPLKKSKTLSDFFSSVDEERRKSFVSNTHLQEDLDGRFWSRRLRESRVKRSPGTSGKGDRMTVARATYQTPLFKPTNRRQRRSNYFYTTEKTTFAQIAELREGQAFGLESLVQKPTTTLSLVSDGAECIFISKRLFLSLANIKVLRVVTDIVQMYPSQEFTQEQVSQYRRWQKYKADLVQDILSRNNR